MIQSGKQIEIQPQKRKSILIFILSIAGISALGVFIAFTVVNFQQFIREGLWIITCTGSIVFCAHYAWSAFAIIKSKEPALIIDEEGIRDYSNRTSVREISWTEINNLSVVIIQRQKIIMLQVKNPAGYISKETDQSLRAEMSMSYHMFGTPVNIAASKLNIPFDELMSLISQYFNASRDGIQIQDRSILVWQYGEN